ncbi:MAG: hypothetical protein ACQEXJ_06540 [Myxococcota bacterium]
MRSKSRRDVPPPPGDDFEARADVLFLAFSLGLLTLTLALSLAVLV